MTKNADVKSKRLSKKLYPNPARLAGFSGVSISNSTRGPLPRVEFANIARAVLGARYELSVVLVGDSASRTLNRRYRHKDHPTNILSFPLSATEGEMYLNLQQVRRETKFFERSFRNLVAFLFIHGLFHLKGYDHGATMERRERQVRRKFHI